MKKFNFTINSLAKREIIFLSEGLSTSAFKKARVNFSYKDSSFSIKNLENSIFLIEKLFGQKIFLSVSRKDVAFWRLRKKQLVALSITLQKNSVSRFLEKKVFCQKKGAHDSR